MPITFGKGDLLEYDAKYRVLICRDCKYAVQKSALGSHLLRHKIYRGERQRLLSFIARLDLLEPDGVQLPLAGSTPVDGLPIISGYKCTATGCESLCASTKRMRRHWSEKHGVSDPSDSFARSVSLQTFFRGTKLRYFEVASPGATAGRSLDTSERLELDGLNAIARAEPQVQISTTPPYPYDLDMEMLRYFHHFTTTTSLTLPSKGHEPWKYWQMDVVSQALHLRWLMCGLLAISASHLAVLSAEQTTMQLHQKRSAYFIQEFSIGWEEVKHDSGMTDSEEAKTGAQMICIQSCCHWALESAALDQRMVRESMSFQLPSLMTTVQGCVDREFALRFAGNDLTEETFIQARNVWGGSSDVEGPSNTPPALLERLRSLPYRMAEALEKPENASDFFATLSAIDVLVESCSLSYASDDTGAAWLGMESWLRRLSDQFNRMIWRENFAALVVLAHWSLLVKRAERHCWFLKGSTTKLLQQIIKQFPEDSAVQSLVENLMD